MKVRDGTLIGTNIKRMLKTFSLSHYHAVFFWETLGTGFDTHHPPKHCWIPSAPPQGSALPAGQCNPPNYKNCSGLARDRENKMKASTRSQSLRASVGHAGRRPTHRDISLRPTGLIGSAWSTVGLCWIWLALDSSHRCLTMEYNLWLPYFLFAILAQTSCVGGIFVRRVAPIGKRLFKWQLSAADHAMDGLHPGYNFVVVSTTLKWNIPCWTMQVHEV